MPSPASERSPRGAEHYDGSAERLIEKSRVEEMILSTFDQRIDTSGRVKPVTVKRRLVYDAVTKQASTLGAPLKSREIDGFLLPEPSHRRTVTDRAGNMIDERISKFNTNSHLYRALTDPHDMLLSHSDIYRLNQDTEELSALASAYGYSARTSSEQREDAIHLKRTVQPSTPQLSPGVRMYIEGGGINAPKIVSTLIANGARPSHAKIWIPDRSTDWQRFRTDTPILEFDATADLEQAVELLRTLQDRLPLPATAGRHLVGLAIEGVPFAYIGQSDHAGGSFNQSMADLFSDAIEQACKSMPLQTGDTVTREWLGEVSDRAIGIATELSSDDGRDRRCHALKAGPSADQILRIARGR